MKFQDIEFGTVVVDPPWNPTLNKNCTSEHSKASPARFYDVMDLSEICELKPRFAKQSHLYIWCISQHVDWAYSVAESWKASPVILWTWKKPVLGCGRFRCNTEHILVCRIGSRSGNAFGSGSNFAQATNGTCFEWKRGRHSEKPDEFYELVEKISFKLPRLDMYARKSRNGWFCYGNEIGFIDLNGDKIN